MPPSGAHARLRLGPLRSLDARPLLSLVTAETAAGAASGSARLVRNILILSGGQVVSWASGIIWLSVVPHRLGPAAMGEFVVATSTAAIVGIIVGQGAVPLLTREIARDRSKIPGLVGGAIVMRLATAVPACLALFLYVRLAGFSPERVELIALATAISITASVTGVFGAAFMGLERMEFNAFTGLIGNTMVSFLGIGVVLLGGRVPQLLMLALILWLVDLALNAYWARGLFRIAWRGAVRAAVRVSKAGISFWIGGLLFTFYLWIDSILLSILAPAKVVGWYGVPTQLFASLLMVGSVLCTAWFPRMSAAHAAGPETLRRSARPAVETAVVVSLPIAAGTALVAGNLILVFCGPAFYGAVPVLVVLSLCVVPTFFNMMADQILAAEGRQASWVKVIGIATALNVGANLFLIPRFQALGNGAEGAALSLLATEVFELAAAVYLLPWLLSRELLTRSLRALIATLLMAAAVFAASRAGLVAEVVAGVVAFAVFATLLRVLTSAEITLLRGLGARVRTRLRPPPVPA